MKQLYVFKIHFQIFIKNNDLPMLSRCFFKCSKILETKSWHITIIIIIIIINILTGQGRWAPGHLTSLLHICGSWLNNTLNIIVTIFIKITSGRIFSFDYLQLLRRCLKIEIIRERQHPQMTPHFFLLVTTTKKILSNECFILQNKN